jgi:uroporphyrinogen-III decarboxylase
MNSRQRVLKAIAGEAADRTPARFNAAPDGQTRRIARGLGIASDNGWYDELHARLAIDMRIVDADVSGADYGGDHMNLAAAESPADADRLWPAKFEAGNRTFDRAMRQVEGWDRGGNPPAVQVRLNSLFGLLRRMRGDTLACMDLADASPLFVHTMDRIEAFNAAVIDKAFDAFGDRLDIVYLADELGMQSGLMYSPESIRAHLFARFGRLFARVHARGGKVFFHSCGAIAPLIHELIGLGVDILNPIQPRLPGMEPEQLAAAHGGRVCFCGGMDMQHLMPQGTLDEIQAEVARYCRVLAPGYILDLANILHPDIPDTNVIALYTAPRS